MSEWRECTRCHGAKSKSEFGAHPKGRDGLQAWCKQCRAESIKASRQTEGTTQRRTWQAEAKARMRLVKLHNDEYRALVDEERIKLGLESTKRRVKSE